MNTSLRTGAWCRLLACALLLAPMNAACSEETEVDSSGDAAADADVGPSADGGEPSRGRDGAALDGPDASAIPGMDASDDAGPLPTPDAGLHDASAQDASDQDAAVGCDSSNEYCSDGLCVAYAGEGNSCATGARCSPELYCNGSECESFVSDECPCAGIEVCVQLAAGVRECRTPVGEGELCGFDMPCATALVCAQIGGPEQRCAPAALQGESCGARGCAPGLRCSMDSGTCEPFIAENETCNAILLGECALPLLCAWNDRCVQPEQAIGGSCSVLHAKACAAALYCDRSSHTCQPLGGEGSSCNYGAFGPSGCAAGFYCACDNGLCIGVDLAAPSEHETCVPTLPNDATCAEHFECASQLCDGGKCQDLPPGASICSE